MKIIEKIQGFFLKVERVVNSLDFITRIVKAFGVGMNALNDSLFERNKEALSEYLTKRTKEVEKND